MKQLLFGCAVFIVLIDLTTSHGTVHDPVSRQTRWRYDSSAKRNYDDNGLFCGGFYVQWNKNKGRCGLCGDNFRDRTPRSHELGGIYGQGTIVKNYKSGEHLDVRVLITANHRGYFTFNVCNLDNGRETEKCFNQNRMPLTNGSYRYLLPSTRPGWFNVTLQIPIGLKCNHCVLQWTYVAGNNWGKCPDGSGAVGCGPQEQFRACSDIRIN